jgi:hypothetical protein
MPQERLFTGDGVASIRDLAIKGVRPRVEAFTEAQLQGNSPDDLAHDVADYVMGETVELYTEDHRMSTSIVPVSELDAPVPAAPDGAQPGIEVVQVSLYVPDTGTTRIFKTQPGRALSTPTPEATLTDRQVILSVIAVPGDDGTDAQERLLRLERNLEQWVSAVNRDVAALKADVKTAARDLIAQRVSVRRQRDNMESALTIPLLQLEPGRALQIPLQRKRITPQTTPATAAGEPPRVDNHRPGLRRDDPDDPRLHARARTPAIECCSPDEGGDDARLAYVHAERQLRDPRRQGPVHRRRDPERKRQDRHPRPLPGQERIHR